jgi:glc operon protein GlcG
MEMYMTVSRPKPVSGQLLTGPDMSLAVADRLLAGALAAGVEAQVLLAAAVVDRGGNVVVSARMDRAQLGAMSLAVDKAFTAVAFGHPTGNWAQSSGPGGSDWGLDGTLGGRAIVFPGGLPVFAGGALIGAVGVSGAASVVDEQCARQAIGACGFESRPADPLAPSDHS